MDEKPVIPPTEGFLNSRRGLRPPWKPGESGQKSRISHNVMTAVRLARKHCPDAIQYAYTVMKDVNESTTLRLKAVDLILTHGMPRGDNSRYMGEETIGAITLNIVYPKVEPAPDTKPVIDAVPITVDTPTQGSGD